MMLINNRGIINGMTGKAATLPKFSDMLNLSRPGGADYSHPLALPHLLPHRLPHRGYAPGIYYS